jgi:ketosteroid isomerase-like protein
MKGITAILLLAVCTSTGRAETRRTTPNQEAILTVIRAQEDAWNRGDLEGFMQGYWKSSQTTFSGANGTLRGWQAVHDRYVRQYGNRELMGHLNFSGLEVTLLGSGAALVIGQWKLQRSQPMGGIFSLVFRKINGKWRIIHDHTSVVTSVPVTSPHS